MLQEVGQHPHRSRASSTFKKTADSSTANLERPTFKTQVKMGENDKNVPTRFKEGCYIESIEKIWTETRF